MRNPQNYRRVVLKFGTSLLTSGGSQLDIDFMAGLVAQVAGLLARGLEVIIVTSGAVAAGRHRLGLAKGLKGVPLKQVFAAVGQSRLMRLYEELFEKHNLIVAQALITRGDLTDRSGYLNARNTLLALLELGVTPIVNENDVVAVEELGEARFGDNDNLSAMVANLVDADLLVILTDIAGLYTADPHRNPEASLVPEVRDINDAVLGMAEGTSNRTATGGMVTKVEAARLATSSGGTVVIADGRLPGVIERIAQGEAIGTRFLPTAHRESRARWMLSGLSTHGRLVIDNGAAQALSQHKSLLSAGIISTEGEFARGDILDLYNTAGVRVGSGITNYGADDIAKIKGAHSEHIGELLGYDYGAEVVHCNNLALLGGD
jgi:glutamate 5-kinase